ncbi:MAG: metallophosphoesterase [Nitrososphaeria archaeon]
MLIAHISDTHLGAMPYNLRERENDFYEAFSEAIETAIREGAEAIVHSGDVFDAPRASYRSLSMYISQLRRLSDRNIKFLFTLGEHDISRIGGSAVALVARDLGLGEFLMEGERHEHNGVAFYGAYNHRRGELDDLRAILNGLKKAEDRKKVLVLHQGLYEFHQYAGQLFHSELPSGFDYYALGHLHDPGMKRFSDLKGPVCYAGSTEFTSSEGINESDKGFWLVDLSGDQAQPQFIKLQSVRPRRVYEIRYEQLQQEIDRIASELKSLLELSKKKPMARIIIRGRGMNESYIRGIINPIYNIVLRMEYELVDEGETRSYYSVERAEDVEAMFREIARRILNDDRLVEIADGLRGYLEENRLQEASDYLWRIFMGEADQ